MVCSLASRPKSTIVVVDWGGGGVEATVLRRTDGVLSVAGQAADPSVGGGVFTERLVKFCAKDFKRRTGSDIFESRRSVLKARGSFESTCRCWVWRLGFAFPVGFGRPVGDCFAALARKMTLSASRSSTKPEWCSFRSRVGCHSLSPSN